MVNDNPQQTDDKMVAQGTVSVRVQGRTTQKVDSQSSMYTLLCSPSLVTHRVYRNPTGGRIFARDDRPRCQSVIHSLWTCHGVMWCRHRSGGKNFCLTKGRWTAKASE